MSQEVEVKMYFSDIEHVIKFLCNQDPLTGFVDKFKSLQYDLKYPKYFSNKENLLSVQDKLESLSKDWQVTIEHVNNMILILETYLDTSLEKYKNDNDPVDEKPEAIKDPSYY